MSRKNRIIQFVPIALAIGLGLSAIMLTGPARTEFVDSSDYLAHANVILETGQYPNEGNLPIFRPPLYPVFIAALWSIFPGSIVAIKLVQVALFAFAAWLIFKTAMRITENQFLSLAASTVFAANPFIIFVAVSIQSEIVHIFLISLMLYIASGMLLDERIRFAPAAALGAVLGVAALCKPSALGVGAAIAAVMFLIRFRQKGSLAASAVIGAAMLITVLPWSLYLLKTKGEFILVSDGGGYNLWSGNLPELVNLYERNHESTAEEFALSDHFSMTVSRRQIAEWEQTVGYQQLSLKQREGLWRAKAIENMKANPGITLKLFGWKLFNYWKPYVNPNIHSKTASVLSAVFLVPFFLLGAFGIFRVWKDARTRGIAYLFGAIAVSATLIHVLLVSSIRLRLPYVDPFLAIFAAIGLGSLLARLFAKVEWLNLGKRLEIREFAAFCAAEG